MKIYGAGSIEDIKHCLELGVSGILTNPQGFDQYFKGEMTLEDITKSICDVTDLPVFIQIHGNDSNELVNRAKKLHQISPQVGFKIIADKKGFNAISSLKKENINCIATALFSLSQAAIAANVGAFGICPFVSRGQAVGIDTGGLLSDIRRGYDRLERAPEIIAVSLKSTLDVEMAIKSGADAIGMRYPLMEQMMEHPLSTRAELLFVKNWSNVLGEDVSYISNSFELGEIAE